jgi:hypothetical protein
MARLPTLEDFSLLQKGQVWTLLWVEDAIRVNGKDGEKIKVIHPILKKETAAEMRRPQESGHFDLDEPVVHYNMGDTASTIHPLRILTAWADERFRS